MTSATDEGKKPSSSTIAHPGHRFSLSEIRLATENFADKLVIGKGEVGTVYKGHFFSEATRVVAIKQLYDLPISVQEKPGFKAEIDMLCKLRHNHLVCLIGYCDDENEIILVYEYIPYGNLYHHLHIAHTPLSWVTRLKIAIGVARGLNYLHTGVGTHNGIMHCNVRSSNILLDENWEAKISDSGLSKFYSTNQSKFIFYPKFLDPNYISTGILTRKSDVYSFGVVLFELLSGRLAFDNPNEGVRYSLVSWARKCVDERKLDQMVDSDIKGTISTECLRQFAQLADDCMHRDPKERPTMRKLEISLQALLELQERPNRSAKSSGIMGFSQKIFRHFVPATKPKSDNSETISQKSLDKKKDQHDE